MTKKNKQKQKNSGVENPGSMRVAVGGEHVVFMRVRRRAWASPHDVEWETRTAHRSPINYERLCA